jgi:hypothetical protein
MSVVASDAWPRREATRLHVLELMREDGVSQDSLAILTDHSPSRLQRMLQPAGPDESPPNLPLRDLGALVVKFGAARVLAPWAAAGGHRLIAALAAAPTAGDLVAQAASALREASDAVSKLIAASSGPLTPSAGAALEHEIDEAIAELTPCKAQVRARTIGAPTALGGIRR